MKNLIILNSSIEKSIDFYYEWEHSQLYDSNDASFYSFPKSKAKVLQDMKENNDFALNVQKNWNQKKKFAN